MIRWSVAFSKVEHPTGSMKQQNSPPHDQEAKKESEEGAQVPLSPSKAHPHRPEDLPLGLLPFKSLATSQQ
jgi:hypothetical protein